MDPTFSNAGYHELKSIVSNTATSVSLTQLLQYIALLKGSLKSHIRRPRPFLEDIAGTIY